jgi:RNA polymerase sigma factor (sigma-70 family)
VASPGEELIARLGAGEPGAFEEAYRLYAPHCRAVAFRVLADDAAAQDAVQEAFLSLWRHRDGLVVRTAGIGPWLVVVARNAAIGIARAASRRSGRESTAAAVETIDPLDALGTRAEAVDVRNALSSLPDEQRTVLTMAYFGGHTLASVAERTATPLGTVKRRAQLALRKMAQQLGGLDT